MSLSTLDYHILRTLTGLHWSENALAVPGVSLGDLQICIFQKPAEGFPPRQKVLMVFDEEFVNVICEFRIPPYVGVLIHDDTFLHAWGTMLWALS
jgi:hypothetical protein